MVSKPIYVVMTCDIDISVNTVRVKKYIEDPRKMLLAP